MPICLFQNLDCVLPRRGFDLSVRRPTSQPVYDYPVTLLLHPLEQFAHPPFTDSDLLGRLALTDHLIPRTLQPLQLVPFLLAHRNPFHPSALRLSRGTFYFGQLGTFHFGATAQKAVCQREVEMSYPERNRNVRY